MASRRSRGPDWDFYQCKCGNIIFEYNTITGERCLTDTWKNCTTTCMEPVSYVPPPCTQPFTSVTNPISRPRINMATQTSEDICSRSVDTQTTPSSCACCSSSVLPASNVADTNHADVRSVVTDTTESKKDLSQEKPVVTSHAKDLVETEQASESTKSSPPLNKGKGSKAEEEVEDPGPTKGSSDRVLRKRRSGPVGENCRSKDANRKSKKSNKRL